MQIYFSYLYVLGVVWFLALYYGERIYPASTFSSCKWPKDKLWPAHARPTQIALVADPQIIDAHTYPGRNRILQRISESVVDLYLRRNWVYINSKLDPDANFFVGDLFDGGREWADPVWGKEFQRWNKIFPKPEYKRTVMSLPGNHDIGYGDTIIYNALQRFSMFFGEPSSSVDVGNHTIVLLDTISMMNHKNSTIYERPYNFLNTLIKKPNFYERPKILLTHVPLYRDPKRSCGPDRESKNTLPYVKGYQYQTMIEPDVSKTVLNAVRPEAIFSGDDHDACYIVHNYTISQALDPNAAPGSAPPPPKYGSAAEYTVKSISMAMGIQRPAIQLLSLYYDPTDPTHTEQTPSFATNICYMPSPFRSYVIYIVAAIFTGLVVITFNFAPDLIYCVFLKTRPLSISSPLDSSDNTLPMYNANLKKPSSSVSTTVKPLSASSSSNYSSPSSSDESCSNQRLVKQVKFVVEGSILSSDKDDDFYSKNSNGRSIGAILHNARVKLGHKLIWKKAFKEFAYVALPSFTYYMILLYSMYRIPPAA